MRTFAGLVGQLQSVAGHVEELLRTLAVSEQKTSNTAQEIAAHKINASVAQSKLAAQSDELNELREKLLAAHNRREEIETESGCFMSGGGQGGCQRSCHRSDAQAAGR